MLKFHARTDVGLKRKHNEDSLLAAEEFGVFVVADGVGGRKAGELASAITVNTFQSYAPRLKAAVDAFASDANRDTRNAVLQLLDQAANAAGCKQGDCHKGQAQQDGPPVDPLHGVETQIDVRGLPAGKPGREE